MRSQIKAITIAAVAGLVVAILTQVPTAISKGGITPLDTFDIFNSGVLGHWVGRLGVIPLICIIVAAGVTARKAGLLISILNTLGAIVVVSIVISVSVIALAASQQKEFPLSSAGPERTDFITNLLPSCIKGIQALPENKNVSAASINQLCTCYGNSLADVMTTTELQEIGQHHAPSTNTTEKLKATYQKCNQIVRGAAQ